MEEIDMAKKVVIAGACRTAIGKMGGVLSTVPAVDMGSIVIKEALKRAGVPADQVDHVYMGCVIQAGLGQNVARQASLNVRQHLRQDFQLKHQQLQLTLYVVQVLTV